MSGQVDLQFVKKKEKKKKKKRREHVHTSRIGVVNCDTKVLQRTRVIS